MKKKIVCRKQKIFIHIILKTPTGKKGDLNAGESAKLGTPNCLN